MGEELIRYLAPALNIVECVQPDHVNYDMRLAVRLADNSYDYWILDPMGFTVVVNRLPCTQEIEAEYPTDPLGYRVIIDQEKPSERQYEAWFSLADWRVFKQEWMDLRDEVRAKYEDKWERKSKK